MNIVRCQHLAVLYRARHTAANAAFPFKMLGDLADNFCHCFRCCRIGGLNAMPVRQQYARRCIHNGAFDTACTDINTKNFH